MQSAGGVQSAEPTPGRRGVATVRPGSVRRCGPSVGPTEHATVSSGKGGKGGEDIQYRAAQASPAQVAEARGLRVSLPACLVPGWLARLAAGWRLL